MPLVPAWAQLLVPLSALLSPQVAFAQYEGRDTLPEMACLRKVLSAGHHPLELPATGQTFRAVYADEGCSRGWLAVIGTVGRQSYANAGTIPGRIALGTVTTADWAKWLELRSLWGAFGAIGAERPAMLSHAWYLLDWRDSTGYHWRVTPGPSDGEWQAIQWIRYLADGR